MSDPSEAFLQVFAISAMDRYLWVAGYAWVLYDWLITLGQEIDLVWLRRSRGWQSKLHYGFARYCGLVVFTWSVFVFMQSNWSAQFCRVYYYLWGAAGLAQMCGTQGVLMLRIYVMYHRSFKIMVTGITLFAIELVAMATMYFIDARDFILVSPPPPATGCSGSSQHPALAKAYWCIGLVFETFLCILALRSAYSHWGVGGTRPSILTILIRDSLLWYICLAPCLCLNAVAFMTGTGMLAQVGIPAIQAVVSIGVPRFLLNIRASYFSTTRNVPSTRTGCKRSTLYSETEGTAGTIGVFRPTTSDQTEEDDDRVGNELGSIAMGIRTNNGPASSSANPSPSDAA